MSVIVSKRFLQVVALLSLSGSVFAANHGTLTYAPAATAIPTLGSMMLIVMGVILAAVAYLFMRQRKGVHSALVTVLGVGVLLVASGGIKLMDDVWAADGSVHHVLSDPAGGTANISGDDQNTYENTSSVVMKVTAIVLPTVCPDGPVPSADLPLCGVGSILNLNMSCEIDCIDHAAN